MVRFFDNILSPVKNQRPMSVIHTFLTLSRIVFISFTVDSFTFSSSTCKKSGSGDGGVVVVVVMIKSIVSFLYEGNTLKVVLPS